MKGIIPEVFYTMVGETTNLQNIHKGYTKEHYYHLLTIKFTNTTSAYSIITIKIKAITCDM